MGYLNRTPHQKLKAMVDRFAYIAEKAHQIGSVGGNQVLEGEGMVWAISLMVADMGAVDQALSSRMSDAVALWRTVVMSDEEYRATRHDRRAAGRLAARQRDS